MGLTVKVTSNTFAKRGQGMRAKVSQVIRRTAFEIQGGAAERSRVDTGQMKAGWQTDVVSDTEAVVFNSVEHAVYNEYGTAHMTAQPMLHPSVDAARPAFEAALAQVFSE